jgi:SAM-dependent methyltransferase
MRIPSELNRRYWDELTPVHEASRFYDVAGFLAGRSSLHSIEREAVGDVAGKSLLHLQCHFGLDTLSWARLGAEVVGVDFSGASIERARELAKQAGLADQARFLERNVLNLVSDSAGAFDVVFTSYGTITWLSDLGLWARGIAASLKENGLSFMVDTHPTSYLFEADESGRLARRYDYFHGTDPLRIGPDKDYADATHTTLASEAWIWSLGDVFASLEEAGLRVHEFSEYPRTVYQQFPDMRRTSDRYWEFDAETLSLPLLFSLKARRKAGAERI